jgi:hypothetical protein
MATRLPFTAAQGQAAPSLLALPYLPTDSRQAAISKASRTLLVMVLIE